MMVTGRSCLILNEELVLWDLLNERIAREFTVYSGASRFVEKGVIAYSFETRHVEVFSIVDNRAYNLMLPTERGGDYFEILPGGIFLYEQDEADEGLARGI
jgi:hypothetical protein